MLRTLKITCILLTLNLIRLNIHTDVTDYFVDHTEVMKIHEAGFLPTIDLLQLKTSQDSLNKTIDTFSLYKTCIWFLKSSEGLRLKEYRCPANRRTIGWGHLMDKDEIYNTITVNEADSLFKIDFDKTWTYVNKTYPHFDIEHTWSITLLLYNLGTNGIKGTKLDRYLRESKYDLAAIQILKYNKARNHKNNCSKGCRKCRLISHAGLTKKRKFEALLLLKDYDQLKEWQSKNKEIVELKIEKAFKLLETTL